MKSTFIILVLVAAAFAQGTPSGQMVSAKQVLERYQLATYGAMSNEALRTIRISGSLSIPPSTQFADLLFQEKKPSSDVLSITTMSGRMSTFGRNHGRPMATMAPDKGLFEAGGVPIWVLEQIFRDLTDCDYKAYETIRLLGVSEIQGRRAFAMEFATKHSREVRYYDAESYLMTGIDIAQLVSLRPGKFAAYKIEVTLSDYQKSGELSLPRKLQTKVGKDGETFEWRLNTAEVNRDIDDSVFNKDLIKLRPAAADNKPKQP